MSVAAASPGIAIVGMACRYPDARTPGELWENVLARRRAFRRVPAERLSLEDFKPRTPDDPDSLYVAEAALLEGWEFDRVRFKVAGRTHRSTDHAHWLALEVAAQALADAGFPDAQGLPRDATGVLLGNTLTGEFTRANTLRLRWPYVRRVLAASLAEEGWESARIDAFLARLEPSYKSPFPTPMEETLAGGLSNTIAGRICNHFDLHGGGYTLDGACASSLLAVANACSALAAGDLDVALAGGVDLSLDPFELVGFSRVGALTPGEMRVFDARSQGFLPGEGCGFVVMMREADAARLGCRGYAVIRGWGLSSDGAGGISRPEAEGQKMALARAYRRAGFGVDTIGYFEGHGTGTAVGDAAELKALTSARREAAATLPAALGSIKANIGHTKAAAGVAGLIKAVLAVHHQVLPPTTGCEDPHPELAEAPLRVLAQGEPWPADQPLRAAVSAMGFGGINAHVVVEAEANVRRRALAGRERELLASWQDAELLLLSAPDATALADTAQELAGKAGRLSRAELTDLAAELARRGAAGSARLAVVATKPAEAAERLRLAATWLREGESARIDVRQGIFLGDGTGGRRLGFLFPGQGSPSHLDGGLWRRRFEELEAVYEPAGLDPRADAVHTSVAQPAIVAHALAGLWLLDRLGLRAAVAVGHSLGEIAALHWAGALDARATLRLAALRGQAMGDADGEPGAMASLGTDLATAEALLAGTGAVVAALNAPRRTVVSGPTAAVETVIERARDRGLEATKLRVSHAFHSPLMAPAVGRLEAGLAGIALRAPARPVASTVTGGLLEPAADPRSLLLEQLTAPVRFTEALEAAADRADLWIVVGPGQAAAELFGETIEAPVIALDAGGPSIAGLLKAAGAAFALGAPLDAGYLFEGRFSRPLDLDRPLRFLINPCELAPAFHGDAAVPGPAPRPAAVAVLEEPEPAIPALPMAAVSGDRGAREMVRQLVAERAELPVESVADDSRLLSDLHLNSISVGQLVVEASRRLGLRPPASPTDYARATVAEVAQALEQQAPAGPAQEELGAPAGVDTWVRAFRVDLVPRALPRQAGADGGERAWKVIAPPGHPLGGSLAGRLPGRGVALCLPAEPDDRQIPLFVEAARTALGGPKPLRFALVHQGGTGGGFARTLHLEVPDATTTVVDVPLDHPEAADWVAAEVAAGSGYTEACYDAQGHRRVPVLHLDDGGTVGPLPLGPEDVLLVTGGGKGIAAECALDLARTTGVRLALLGRSRPEEDAELAANLERMSAAGVTLRYASADVTDATAVAAAVAWVESGLGPVTAVLHGAGTNAPRLLSAMDEAGFARTLAPKTAGLANVLAAVNPDRLRLLVTFGSIIARIGLRGEAEYAVANEQLARATERFSREHPGCRCLALEWSVWAGVGMGERLGTLESLRGQGITPIPPEAGVALLRDLIARQPSEGAPVSLVVTSRFGDVPTLEVPRPELPLLRYLEKPRVQVPGVELVVDAEVSADTDPHLADHVFRGEPLFAAVLGLEAMAQTAMALLDTEEIPVFENAVFARPVAVPAGRSTTLRVAALVRSPGVVDVVLREASTGFAADHFRATCRFGVETDAAPRHLVPVGKDGERVPLDPVGDLYSGILFHRGRFRRVQGYRSLRATECLAEISPNGTTAWFGRYLPDRLVLGDPGARDAAIHGIQACIPHSTLLPIGVERVTSFGLEKGGPLLLAARERRRDGDEFLYDLELLTPEGEVRERWEGLKLRAVDRTDLPAVWSAALLGPYVERRLQEILPGSHVRVALEEETGRKRRHRPDGKPDAAARSSLSISHAGTLTLSVANGGGRIGCDLEPVAARSGEVWEGLLGAERFRLAELIARERGESRDAAATRVWAAAESLTKAGAPHGAPLVLEASGGEDGWLLLRSGELTIGTYLAPVRELRGPAAFAILIDGAESVH